MFPTISLSKALTLGGYVNVRVLRDHAKREAFAAAEQTRQALRYIGPPPPNHPTHFNPIRAPPLTKTLEKQIYRTEHTTPTSAADKGAG